MAALPDLITVAQFRQLPEGGEFAYELHHGEAAVTSNAAPQREKPYSFRRTAHW
ncbi:MAG: hypothetical protein ABSF62_16120 [Bryobacteraceae bacterium]|jgi:hypothetical protein